MSIKTKLILSFVTLITLVLAMAGVSIWLGQKSNEHLKSTLRDYSIMTNVSDIQFSLEKLLKSFNYYLILGEEEEKRRYDEFAEIIHTGFKEWNKLTINESEKGEVNIQKQWYEKMDSIARKIIQIYDSGAKDHAMQKVDKELLPLSDEFRKSLKEEVNKKVRKLENSKTKVDSISKMSLIVSLIVSCFSALWGLIMSIIIFRGIAVPLSSLQEGAHMIGEGNFDYHIKITAKDELGQLAKSFNLMVDNLKNLQGQIVQMDRMSSLGQMAGGVAHELNNPLTGVLGQAQLLMEKLSPEDPTRASLEKIERAAQRCRKIVRALLDFARQKDYTFQTTDIHHLVDESLDFSLSDITSAKVTLKKNYQTDLPQIMVSASHIQQVFLNLITNAIQSMNPNGGTLTISTTHIPKCEELDNKSCVKISFKDTGIGIKTEHISHVFDPFFTTKEIGKGTGLGLTVSYGIVQRHNGKIIVHSEGLGKGAEFSVLLPA